MRREVPAEVLGLHDGVEGRARRLGRPGRDLGGAPLERTAVDRHEPELRPELDSFGDSGMREEVGEHEREATA